jgi:hypothetical protein
VVAGEDAEDAKEGGKQMVSLLISHRHLQQTVHDREENILHPYSHSNA